MVSQTFLSDKHHRITPAKSGSPPGYDKLMHSAQITLTRTARLGG